MMIGKRSEVTQISERNHNCKQNNFPETLAKICDWLYLVLQLNFSSSRSSTTSKPFFISKQY